MPITHIDRSGLALSRPCISCGGGNNGHAGDVPPPTMPDPFGGDCVAESHSLESCIACCDVDYPGRPTCKLACRRIFDRPPNLGGPPVCSVTDDPTLSDQEMCALMATRCAMPAGFTICRNGRKISCTNPGAPSYPAPGSPTESIFTSCIVEHEDTHHDDIDCGDCAPGTSCRPQYAPGKNKAHQECIAWIATLACLERRLQNGECGGDPACEAGINDWMVAICGATTIQCGGAAPTICSGYTGWQ